VIEAETALTKLRAISKTSAFNEWLGLEVTAASEGRLNCNWLGAASSDNIRDFSTPDSWGR